MMTEKPSNEKRGGARAGFGNDKEIEQFGLHIARHVY